jgi:acyl-CoA thioester hydrolase
MRPGRRERRRETSIEIDIPFRHVDLLGVVWHGHYYEYMEEARTALLRACELDAGDLIGPRYLFYVIESKCRYIQPLRYRDRLRVSAWLLDVQHRIHIAYELSDARQPRRVARGHTILATTDSERRLLLETPDEIRRRLLS